MVTIDSTEDFFRKIVTLLEEKLCTFSRQYWDMLLWLELFLLMTAECSLIIFSSRCFISPNISLGNRSILFGKLGYYSSIIWTTSFNIVNWFFYVELGLICNCQTLIKNWPIPEKRSFSGLFQEKGLTLTHFRLINDEKIINN